MKTLNRSRYIFSIPMVIVGMFLLFSVGPALAEDPKVVGKVSPTLPMYKDAISLVYLWTKKNRNNPKFLFWMRPAQFQGIHVADKNAVDDGEPLDNTLRTNTFFKYVFGDRGVSTGGHGLDESNVVQFVSVLERDNALVFDPSHHDAFKPFKEKIFDATSWTEEQYLQNQAAFTDVGFSRGLNYDIFCSGQVIAPDGKVVIIGGHDMNANSGLRQINIFDPDALHHHHHRNSHHHHHHKSKHSKALKSPWAPRQRPAVTQAYLDGSPYDEDNPPEFTEANGFPDPRAKGNQNTDPVLPSSMKYGRWYPSGTTLPDGRVLILSGTDMDITLDGSPVQGNPFFNCNANPKEYACSKERIWTPEVYDPRTETTIALENARKVLAMFPHAYVVSTGVGENDWKVVVLSVATVQDNKLAGDPRRGGFDPWNFDGKTYTLDVLGALAGSTDTPGFGYWEMIAEADHSHYNAASAFLVETDKKGYPVSQQFIAFGGSETGRTPPTSSIEKLTFTGKYASSSGWEPAGDLMQLDENNSKIAFGANQNQAAILPDGTIGISGGNQVDSRANDPVFGDQGLSLYNQLFNPEDDSITILAKSELSCHDHCTTLTLPNGKWIRAGTNRSDIAGDVPDQEALDSHMPVAQLVSPPYLFWGDRPQIRNVPMKISYGDRFKIALKHGSGKIKSVSLIRLSGVSHSRNNDLRYIKLWFKQKEHGLIVRAPKLPATAIPGYYMVSVVNKKGVPSKSKLVHVDWGGAHRM